MPVNLWEALGERKRQVPLPEATQFVRQRLSESAGGTPSAREVRDALKEGGYARGAGADDLVAAVVAQTLGLGPLEPLLKDPTVSEIMVVDYDRVFVERAGRIEGCPVTFQNRQEIVDLCQRAVSLLGRELSRATPLVDGRLEEEGLRLTATVPPFSRVPTLTIRRPITLRPDPRDYLAAGSASAPMLDLFRQLVRARINILISGATGSGKTTLARLLGSMVPHHERIITIEETRELALGQLHPHVIELETRDTARESRFLIDTQMALRHVLHMRPDRIILGEIRGPEALGLLTAMASGHSGSFATLHADRPERALQRLVHLMLQAQSGLTAEDLLTSASQSVGAILHLERGTDGKRRVVEVAEPVITEGETVPRLLTLFSYQKGRFLALDEPSRSLQRKLDVAEDAP